MKKKEILIGLAVAITLAIFSFLASSSPDGLERVAEDKNFLHQAKIIFNAPMPDYVFPGVPQEKVAGSLAGVTGVLVIFAAAFALGKILAER